MMMSKLPIMEVLTPVMSSTGAAITDIGDDVGGDAADGVEVLGNGLIIDLADNAVHAEDDIDVGVGDVNEGPEAGPANGAVS